MTRPSAVLRAGLLWMLAAALGLAACDSAPPEAPWPDASPALWEVTGEHGERGWLFGTIHALPDGVEWRTPAFEAAFGEADVLMVEIADLANPEESARAFETFATSQPLPPLSTRVAEKDRPALAALMERAGKTDADFWNIETWAAALVLGNAVRTGDPANGVDRALLQQGKPADALESFASQFARFDRLAEADQRELLAAAVRESGQADRERVEAWLTGDLAALEGLAGESFLSDAELRQALLTDRNEAFAGRVAEALERGRKPFVAVGAAHMLGQDGLPALLAARGYAVRRVQ